MDSYLKNIYSFQSQLEERGLVTKRLLKLKRGGRPDGIVVVGMGGSGLAGDLIKGLRSELRIPVPVEVVKNSKIPKLPFRKPFFIFVSFSGNTSEVMGALKSVVWSKNVKIAIVTTGGKLGTLSDKLGLPEVRFDSGDLTPRQSVGYTYKALKKLLLTQFSSIKRFPTPRFSYRNLEKISESLARKLKEKIVLLYSREADAYIANFWKTALNETGKTMAFRNTFPEVAHNELVSFESRLSRSVYIIFLSPPNAKTDTASASLRTFLALAKGRGVSGSVVSLGGKNPEEVAWNAFLLAHLTSYHLAKILKRNPIETKLIKQFKNQTG